MEGEGEEGRRGGCLGVGWCSVDELWIGRSESSKVFVLVWSIESWLVRKFSIRKMVMITMGMVRHDKAIVVHRESELTTDFVWSIDYALYSVY